MTEQTVSRPGDRDRLDGKAEIELPSERYTKVLWDADILDLDDKNKHDTILGTEELFKVRFRVELRGRLWRCITGDWKFDLGFKPIGVGRGFYLSELLPNAPGFVVKDWKGCQGLYIEQVVTVPPGTIKLDDNQDTEVYEVAAKTELRCCDGHLAVAGFEALEEYEFFRGD